MDEDAAVVKGLEPASTSCIYHVTTKMSLVIHPSRSHDVSGGVREQLNQMLLRYDSKVEGVVLATTSWEPSLKTGRILNGLDSYFRLDIVAKLMVFKPQIGQHLEARVNFVGRAHVGFLVMGVFNGRVAGAEVAERFEFQSGERQWISKADSAHHIKVGTHIRLTVISVNIDKFGFIEISGTLRETGTGALAWLDKRYRPTATSTPRSSERPSRGRDQEVVSSSKRKGQASGSKDGKTQGVGSEDGKAGQSVHTVMEMAASGRVADEDEGRTPSVSRKESHAANGHGKTDKHSSRDEGGLKFEDGKQRGSPSRSHKNDKKQEKNGLLKRGRSDDIDENGKGQSKSKKRRKKEEV